jgi:hypothetical protein
MKTKRRHYSESACDFNRLAHFIVAHDARNEAADIERVCTRSGFRRRGFPRAVIQECLRRLRAPGPAPRLHHGL